MFRSKLVPAAMAAVLAAGVAGTAFAGDRGEEMGDRQEITTILNAKTSLAQAIAIAEQQTGGKAMESSLEQQAGTAAYEVRIAKADGVQKVLVAPDSGKVLKVTPVKKAHDEDEEDGD